MSKHVESNLRVGFCKYCGDPANGTASAHVTECWYDVEFKKVINASNKTIGKLGWVTNKIESYLDNETSDAAKNAFRLIQKCINNSLKEIANAKGMPWGGPNYE